MSRRLIDRQPDAVRLTTADFESTDITTVDTLAANVRAMEAGEILVSNVRTLPQLTIKVGPPVDADEYEWTDTGLTPPSSPEGKCLLHVLL